MVAANSTMPAIGTAAAPFSLPDPGGQITALEDLVGAPALVVMFLCNHCPHVKHLGRELALLTQRFMARGVAVVGINSNDAEAYPDDAPDKMTAMAKSLGWDFPYLVDADQSVAKAYRAACTPDFFVFDADARLAYRGRFDASRPSTSVPVTGADLKAAVDAVVGGLAVPEPQQPSMGCSIKWRSRHEPDGI